MLLICTETAVRIKEGFNIVNGCVGLDVVGGTEDKAATGRKFGHAVLYLAAHIISTAVRHGLLDRDTAMKTDAVAELLFDFLIVHTGNIWLEGIEDIETAVNKILHKLMNAAAGVVGDLTAELVANIDKTLESITQQITPHIDGHKGIFLCAKIVAGKKDIDIAPGGFERTAYILGIEVGNTAEYRFGDFRVYHNINTNLLYAADVHSRF